MASRTHSLQHTVTVNNVFSTLVYPLSNGYYYSAKLDKEWVENILVSTFGVDTIVNKYTVSIKGNAGHYIMITNHDGTYWLTERAKN